VEKEVDKGVDMGSHDGIHDRGELALIRNVKRLASFVTVDQDVQVAGPSCVVRYGTPISISCVQTLAFDLSQDPKWHQLAPVSAIMDDQSVGVGVNDVRLRVNQLLGDRTDSWPHRALRDRSFDIDLLRLILLPPAFPQDRFALSGLFIITGAVRKPI
jgi:hypothetical protein